MICIVDPSVGSLKSDRSLQCERDFRPFSIRRNSTSMPPLELSRLIQPWVLLRLMFLGWYSVPLFLVRTCWYCHGSCWNTPEPSACDESGPHLEIGGCAADLGTIQLLNSLRWEVPVRFPTERLLKEHWLKWFFFDISTVLQQIILIFQYKPKWGCDSISATTRDTMFILLDTNTTLCFPVDKCNDLTCHFWGIYALVCVITISATALGSYDRISHAANFFTMWCYFQRYLHRSNVRKLGHLARKDIWRILDKVDAIMFILKNNHTIDTGMSSESHGAANPPANKGRCDWSRRVSQSKRLLLIR